MKIGFTIIAITIVVFFGAGGTTLLVIPFSVFGEEFLDCPEGAFQGIGLLGEPVCRDSKTHEMITSQEPVTDVIIFVILAIIIIVVIFKTKKSFKQ